MFKIFILILFITPTKAQPIIDSNNYVLIKKGIYLLGQKNHSINPLHEYKLLNNYYISKYEVTNAEFRKFVSETKYKTTAEKYKNANVFHPPQKEYRWTEDSTANWQYPNGYKEGGIENKMNHPVTCISFYDILQYCKWANVRLPSINEWEIAARGGNKNFYFYGNNNTNAIKYGNIFHAKNHKVHDTLDGFNYTSPVGSFLPNAYGLFDVYGNVFEYCSDKPKAFKNYKNAVSARGGSWWCSPTSCGFFNSVDIGKNDKYSSFSNQGFRVILK